MKLSLKSVSMFSVALVIALSTQSAFARHQQPQTDDWDPSEDVVNPFESLERTGSGGDLSGRGSSAHLVAICGGSIQVTQANGAYYADGHRLADNDFRFNRATYTGVLRLGAGGSVLTCVAPM